jgi:Tol biopolymer transport system component
MRGDRLRQVRALFDAAMEKAPPERRAFVEEDAGSDSALRDEVLSLLADEEASRGFLDGPAALPESLAGGSRLASDDQSGSVQESPRAVAAGARLGPYEIVAPIGSGGMGEVYRARDTRLDRDVAVKVLPRDLAADPERHRRFEQEMRAASALNHPNILAVYDAGWHGGAPFMVTELLEGQTLTERLAQGAPTVRKALEWAVQAARGLAAAHERSIVHRDLKPANMFLTTQGQIKILDFGLAKLLWPDAETGRSAAGDTRGTTPGLVMGTVGYMSPEQVRGEPADRRSDQFSLGCVLYELFCGQAPFHRASAAQTIAAVLEAEPRPVADVNARVPRPVAWIVERCLAKDPHDRYGSTADLARDLELALHRLSELSLPTATVGRRVRGRAGWAVLGVAAGLAIGVWTRRDPPALPVLRYLTYSGYDTSAAAAPDGRTIAFSSTRDGHRRIWLKHVAEGSEVPLTAGEDDHPRFAPDGSMILFARTEDGRVSLYRVASVGGEPRKLVDNALFGDFSPDGRRLAFVRQFAESGAITTVVATAAADGSSVRELVRLDGSHFPAGPFVSPRWSPDGRSLAATQSTLQLGDPTMIAIIDVESGALRRVDPPTGAGVWRGGLAWAGPDQLVCAQPESVVGQQTGTSSSVVLMDIGSRRTTPLLWSPVNVIGLDVLGPGRLILASRTVRQYLRELPLRPGARGSEPWLTHGNGADRQPTYSRDGEWVLFSSNRSGNLDIWSVSRASGALRRLTDDVAHDLDPAWTPDGHLLWSSNRSGRFEVWMAQADGSGARQVTRDGVDAENPVGTPDGRWIVYASGNPATRGIAKIRPDGSGATLVVPGNAIEPEVSPDGRFVAFVADEGSERAVLRVARLADGAVVFEIPLPPWVFWVGGSGVDQGRCRWMPDGRALAFILRETGGSYGVYRQDFAPGVDTSRTRRRLTPREPGLVAESLGVSPDGSHLTVSFREQLFDLMLAEGVGGLEQARRGR